LGLGLMEVDEALYLAVLDRFR
jgi:hypothetical protein